MNLENSPYKVEPLPFDKEIIIPTSKSHSNRALIVGALRGNGFQVHNLSKSTDTLSFLSCLKTIGLKIIHNSDGIIFLNTYPECEKDTFGDVIDLKTGDGGTTNRFLLTLLSLGRKTYRLYPTEKMNERPIDDLIIPLRKMSVSVVTGLALSDAWVSVRGPAVLEDLEKIEIDCRLSTQFATAMMLVFSKQALKFKLKNIHASGTYLKMTEYVLKETKNKNFYIVPVDFSCLAYPLALALIKGRVLIKNCLELDSLQADSEFISLMKKVGGDIEQTKNGLLATSKNTLSSFDVDGSQFPDLVLTLAFVAAHVEGMSKISNLSILRHKESDRIGEMLSLLKNMSVDFSFHEDRNEIEIHGKKMIYQGTNIKTARDHRVVMIAYLFLRANSGGILSEIDCVEKSFPNFFDIMR